MIKVRLTPTFLYSPDDAEENWVLDVKDTRKVFFIECELPCIPSIGTIIPLGAIKHEIFHQYSHLLLRFNKNLCQAIDNIRKRADNDIYYYLRETCPNLKNASNADILKEVLYDKDGDSPYADYSIIKVDDITMFPNDEMVYIKLTYTM